MPERKTGLLLVNLGSPAAPTPAAVRRFLREFLSDRRVVNLPRLLWLIILYGFVLPFRPAKTAEAYRKVWRAQGSPLLIETRRLAEKLTALTASADVAVDYAMRYGEPSISSRLRAFREQAVNAVVILPLYPQYSSTTTASVYDAVVRELNRWRHVPTFRFVSDYHREPAYIRAVADSIRAAWAGGARHELLLLSFHGLPEQLIHWGDPYFVQCRTTAELIAGELRLQADEWLMVFQSRFGRSEWLKPYCVDILQALPARGIASIDVLCPGFAVDCLETLEEIAITNREIFLAAGGKNYRYIPALNDSDAHAVMLAGLLDRSVE